MNILWLAPIPIIDSTDSHPAPWVMTLAKALVSQNSTLTIVNNNSNIQKDIVKTDFENINIIYIKTPKLKLDFLTLYQLKISRVRQYLKQIVNDFDILHIHGTEHQYEAMSHGLKIPKVISIQGVMSEIIKNVPIVRHKQFLEWKLSALYESRYIPKNHYYSCRTKWDSSFIRSKNPQAKIYMIWEMIREEFFHDHFSEKKDNILFVGGKNSIKGLKELLISYHSSIQSLGFKLIILGNCSIEDIENIINEEQLYSINISNIDCRGMQDSSGMIQAYDESYCLVHPTYIDNSPNSVCEAQLCGLPVIATDVGGVSSLIQNEQTGLLIGRKISDIEYAVKKLYEDDDNLRKRVSKKSREVARKRHDPKVILGQTLDMYKDIIKQRNKK